MYNQINSASKWIHFMYSLLCVSQNRIHYSVTMPIMWNMGKGPRVFNKLPLQKIHQQGSPTFYNEYLVLYKFATGDLPLVLLVLHVVNSNKQFWALTLTLFLDSLKKGKEIQDIITCNILPITNKSYPYLTKHLHIMTILSLNHQEGNPFKIPKHASLLSRILHETTIISGSNIHCKEPIQHIS